MKILWVDSGIRQITPNWKEEKSHNVYNDHTSPYGLKKLPLRILFLIFVFDLYEKSNSEQ